MNFLGRLPVPIAVIVLAAGCASAADLDDLVIAQKALDAAPAYRAIMVGTSSPQEGTGRVTLEVVRPAAARIKTEIDGKTQSDEFADGEKILISEEGGPYQSASPEMSARFAVTRAQLSIIAPNHDDLSHKVAQLKLTGHEVINGVQATLYTGDDAEKPAEANEHSFMRDTHSVVKIWVSDRDHLPLRAEWNVGGTLQLDPSKAGEAFKQEVKVTFEYGPDIKIALPGNP